MHRAFAICSGSWLNATHSFVFMKLWLATKALPLHGLQMSQPLPTLFFFCVCLPMCGCTELEMQRVEKERAWRGCAVTPSSSSLFIGSPHLSSLFSTWPVCLSRPTHAHTFGASVPTLFPIFPSLWPSRLPVNQSWRVILSIQIVTCSNITREPAQIQIFFFHFILFIFIFLVISLPFSVATLSPPFLVCDALCS